jgi:hypothetical protein
VALQELNVSIYTLTFLYTFFTHYTSIHNATFLFSPSLFTFTTCFSCIWPSSGILLPKTVSLFHWQKNTWWRAYTAEIYCESEKDKISKLHCGQKYSVWRIYYCNWMLKYSIPMYMLRLWQQFKLQIVCHTGASQLKSETLLNDHSGQSELAHDQN